MPVRKLKPVFAVTPSPALDLGGVVDGIKPNEKTYVHDETRSPGGNAINASRILTRLGVPVIASGFLGGNIGQEIKFLLDLERVKNSFVKIKGHSRICVTVSNRADNKQTRLTFPGPRITKQERENLFGLFEKQRNISLLVFGGSLPEGLRPQDAIRLMRLAAGRKIGSVIDCPGKVLRELIAGQPLLIKPNLFEFQECTGSGAETIAEVQREARKLLVKVPMVCVSSVEDGAVLVTHQGTFFGRIAKVDLKSTVGAGDSMVGAMVAQLCKGKSAPDELLKWGLAAAAATLEQPGTAFGPAKRILDLYKQTSVVAVK